MTLPRKLLRAVYFFCLVWGFAFTVVWALRSSSAPPLPTGFAIPLWGLPSASIGLIVCNEKRLGIFGLVAFAAIVATNFMPAP